MQQNNEGGGGSQYLGGFSRPAEVAIGDEQHQKLGDLGIAEAASPISSRPPATTNFEDMMRVTAEAAGGSGSATGNRWPRQETMALLRIRSEMDAAFRDASPKGPLWEQVSRKLAELGYKRNGKKCKEKFENVHKYYKRTKEGRTGRQDGKSYKFFTELEALHQITPTAIATSSNPPPPHPMITNNPPPIPVSLPPISLPPPIPQPQAQAQIIPPFITQATAPTLHGPTGISFSSNSSSSSEGEEDDEGDHDQEDIEMESADTRKRKRPVVDIDTDERMMKFFEDLMRQVMQKQESMQQRFIEAIEKREQDRMIREEAWKRQDIARLAREHELMAQERAISVSRDSAIISFLQKITGQTIHFPTPSIHVNPPPPPPTPVSAPPPTVQPPVVHHQPQQNQMQTFLRQQDIPENIPSHSQNAETSRIVHQPTNTSMEIVVAVPEQQIRPRDMSASSRWPKAEVIALIQLRSGMESRYQEAGPKGPLWEEISAGMQRIGYSRNPKRCKEKWENINKYFKKVKESKKMRPEDAKTCPYFHELDALYRKKEASGIMIGGGIMGNLPEQEIQQPNVGSMSIQQDSRAVTGGENQPEDIVRKQHQQSNGNLIGKFCNNGSNSENNVDDEMNYEEVDETEEYDDETEEDMKMAYKIQFQRQNVGSSNGTSSNSFLAMVQ